ncbi:DUF4365 domain-containing protein [Chryseobacterium aureum]|uniref:DUF4365 domain-containing protein n=1 Tax=Chryseobacterium aureum TaxID=2497456 RepID=UPI000F86556E|nr:DUF4365 domain-containing protein [Chryseobacterium aureum]
MKRPTQHVTETISQRIFEDLIPVEWVIREIKPDYGIDYLIEVFKSGQSTGITFFVQLKGSEQKIVHDTFEKQFDVENLNYYASLALPVLIVCVSTTTKQTWGIWANKLTKSLNLRPEQETVKLKFDSENLIKTEYFNQIETELKIVPKYGLIITSDSDLGNVLGANIGKFINHFYPKTFALNNSFLPKHYSLQFLTRGGNHFLLLDGPFFNKEIEIESFDIENPLLHRPLFNEDDINIINAKILKLLVVAFARENLNGSLKLLSKLIENDYFSTEEDTMLFDPLGTLQSSINQDLLLQYNEITKLLIRKKLFETFLFIDVAYFVHSKNYNELFYLRTENLKLAIQYSEYSPIIGNCYYNLGNIERGLYNTDEAIKCYFKARKYLPDYERRKHWWRELAGLLFIKGHYKLAELFYTKSIELVEEDIQYRYFRLEQILPNQEVIVFALIGDCLLLQGKFSKANEWFDKFFEQHNSYSYEWYLKRAITDRCIKLGLDGKKIESEKSIELYEKALELNDFKLQIIEFTKAVELNPTNDLAWFNLGVAKDKEQQFEDAFYCFLTAGLLRDGDKEAQFNALLIAFTQQQNELCSLVLHFIVEKHGEFVSNDLSDYFMGKQIPFNVKRVIIEGIVKLTEEIKNGA